MPVGELSQHGAPERTAKGHQIVPRAALNDSKPELLASCNLEHHGGDLEGINTDGFNTPVDGQRGFHSLAEFHGGSVVCALRPFSDIAAWWDDLYPPLVVQFSREQIHEALTQRR